MSNAPPPKPPEKSHSYLLMLFALCVIVIALGFTYGWFDFSKNKDTGKRELKAHPENVQKSMDATKAWFKDVYAKSKEKIMGAKDKLSSAKTPEAEKLHKDLDEVTKEVNALEAAGKEVDDATKAKFKEVDERLTKFLEEHKMPEKTTTPEKPK